MTRLVLALFLFLSFSCSKIETGLNFAPRIATSRIDDAFDFDSEKLATIRKQIDSDIKDSKKKLAVKIISDIEPLEKQSKNPELTLEQIIKFFDNAAETQTVLLKSFQTSAGLVFKDISEHEIKSFKDYSDKKYDEELELAKDKSDFKKKKRKIFIKNYELFLGQVTLEQEKMIDTFIDNHINYFTQRILARQKFSEEFYLKVKSKDPVMDFFLAHYEGKKFSEINDPSMKEYFSQLFQLQILIWKTTSEKQKIYLRKTLAHYKDELQAIATAQ